MAKAANTWTTAERAFLSGWTNVEFVQSEGSFGLHNWDYSREIVNKAMQQALTAQTGVVVKLPWVVTLKLSKTSIKAGTSVTFSGTVKTAKGVAGAGKVNIMKRVQRRLEGLADCQPQGRRLLFVGQEDDDQGHVLHARPDAG